MLLYELLTGSTPFDKDRLHEVSYDELRRIIREEEPPRPSARISTLEADLATTIAERRRTDARRLLQTVRGELDWIVMKCLDKDRSRRYETAAGLARDIERYLSDEPVEACPPSAGYRLNKFALRNRVALVTLTVVAISLLSGIAVSVWQAVRATRATHIAEAATGRETELRRKAETKEKISRAWFLYRERKIDEVRQLLSTIPNDLFVPDGYHAHLRRRLGWLDAIHERWDEAAANLAVMLQVDGIDSRDVRSLDVLMYVPVLLEQGDVAGYEKLRNEFVSKYQHTSSWTDAERICKISLLLPADEKMMNRIGTLYEYAKEHEVDVKDPSMKAWLQLSLAMVDYRRGNFPKAIEWCRKCLKTSRVTGRTATAEAIAAMSHFHLDQTSEAEAALTRAHEAHDLAGAGAPNLENPGASALIGLYDGLYGDWVLREADALIHRIITVSHNGYAAAELALGDRYARGNWVNQNDAEALKWYRKSAELGNPRDQLILGRMYDTGQGVQQDNAEAGKWYHNLAERRTLLS